MPSLRLMKSDEEKQAGEEDLGGQMSFLEHLDELRTRLIRSMAFGLIAAFGCWWVSGSIYNFLARPVQPALAEAQQERKVTIAGLNGELAIVRLNSLQQKDRIRFAFPEFTTLGTAASPRRPT